MWSNIQGSKSRLVLFIWLLTFLFYGNSYGAITIPSTPEELSNSSLAFLCCSLNFIYILSLIVIPVLVVGFILITLYKAELKRQQEMKNPLSVLYSGVIAGGGIVVSLRVIFDTLTQFGVPVKEYLDLFYGKEGLPQIFSLTGSGYEAKGWTGLFNAISNQFSTHVNCCWKVPNPDNVVLTMLFVMTLALLIGHISIMLFTFGAAFGFVYKGATEAIRAIKYEEDWREGFYRFVVYSVLGFGVSYLIVYLLQIIWVDPKAIAQGWINYIMSR